MSITVCTWLHSFLLIPVKLLYIVTRWAYRPGEARGPEALVQWKERSFDTAELQRHSAVSSATLGFTSWLRHILEYFARHLFSTTLEDR